MLGKYEGCGVLIVCFSLASFSHTHYRAYNYSLLFFLQGFCTIIRPSQPFTLLGPDVTKDVYACQLPYLCVYQASTPGKVAHTKIGRRSIVDGGHH